MECFYIILLCCAILSKFIQCLTEYGLRGIKVNIMRHLALLHVVSLDVHHCYLVPRCQVSRFQSPPKFRASRCGGSPRTNASKRDTP